MTRATAYHGCGRCGIPTTASYCRDCQSVDPAFCADNMTRQEWQDIHREERDREIEDNYSLKKLAGTDYNAATHAAFRVQAAERARKTAERRARGYNVNSGKFVKGHKK